MCYGSLIRKNRVTAPVLIMYGLAALEIEFHGPVSCWASCNIPWPVHFRITRLVCGSMEVNSGVRGAGRRA